METIEDAVRAELERLPGWLRGSALASVALNLAHRLDSGRTPDNVAVLVARELRMVLTALHREGTEVNTELAAVLDGLDTDRVSTS
jgi:hypothetical protein